MTTNEIIAALRIAVKSERREATKLLLALAAERLSNINAELEAAGRNPT